MSTDTRWPPPSGGPRRRARAVSGFLKILGTTGSLVLSQCRCVGGFTPGTFIPAGSAVSGRPQPRYCIDRPASAPHWAQAAPERNFARLIASSAGKGDTGDEASAKPAPVTYTLTRGTPLEIWLSGRLAFATFEGLNPGKASIRVKLAFDEDEKGESKVVSLDAGQVTGVWDGARVSSWYRVQEEAGRILRDVSSKALDLDQFWSQSMKPWKRAKLPSTSHNLAAHLFHRRVYDKLAPLGQEGEIPVTNAQRYAAAVLLASETFRFKRTVPARVGVDEERNAVDLQGAGYRPLDASVVHSREVLSFANAVRRTEEARRLVSSSAGEGEIGTQEGGVRLFWDAVHWRMLHHLEVMALGAGVEGLSSDAQNVLKLLGEEASPKGARAVLLRAGYWSSEAEAAKAGEEGEREKSGRAFMQSSAEPWPQEALDVAKEALARSLRRREALRTVEDIPGNREDYRSAPFAAYCVDPAGSEFADDALSYDPSTDELLVHIADVQGLLNDYPELEKIAWQRGEAFYLPDGPLHLLPPPALRAASLSDSHPNECVTVAVRLGEAGTVESCRLFLSVIPPITRILYEDVNSLMDANVDAIPAYQQAMRAELSTLLDLAARRRKHTQRSFSDAKALAGVVRNSEGNLEGRAFMRSPSHLMVDEFLALYSEACRRFCDGHRVAVPLAAGSANARFDALRFGTGPLRRYADVLAQRQVWSILTDRPPLERAEVRERMLWVNRQRLASQKLRSGSRQRVLLETFATFCSTKARAAQADHAVVRAVATGSGTEVQLPDAGGLLSYVRVADGQALHLSEGEEVEVEVLKVDPLRNDIELVFAGPVERRKAPARRRKAGGGGFKNGPGGKKKADE